MRADQRLAAADICYSLAALGRRREVFDVVMMKRDKGVTVIYEWSSQRYGGLHQKS